MRRQTGSPDKDTARGEEEEAAWDYCGTSKIFRNLSSAEGLGMLTIRLGFLASGMLRSWGWFHAPYHDPQTILREFAELLNSRRRSAVTSFPSEPEALGPKTNVFAMSNSQQESSFSRRERELCRPGRPSPRRRLCGAQV